VYGGVHPDSGARSIYASAAMPVSTLRDVLEAVIRAVDAVTWGVPVVVAVGAVVGLTAAVINWRTALLGRARQRAEEMARVEPPRERKVRIVAQHPHFVDRVDVIEEALAHLRAGEVIVAFHGDSGVGKSAVANELSHRLDRLDTCPSNLRSHDIIYVGGSGGASLSLADICREISVKLGEQSLSMVPDDRKPGALHAYVERQNTVLILDELVAEPGQLDDLLQELLRRPPRGLVMLAAISGPHQLDVGTHVLLRELEPPYARELIDYEADRWDLGDPGLDDTALQLRLAAAVGGNPRLIESFVQTMRDSPRSIYDLLAAAEHGEGIRQVLVPSWPQLPAAARTVLAVCAYLGGEATAEQLVVASALTDDEVLTALGELMRARLVKTIRSGDRPLVYACSRGVQRAVLAGTDTDASDAFTTRLSDWYINRLTDNPEDAQWVVPHVSAIKAVMHWMSDRHDDAGLQVLFGSVLDMLFTLGLFDDRIVTGRLAYGSAIGAGNHRAASLATDVLSSTYAAQGDLVAAKEAAALGQLAAERSLDLGERARQMRATGLVLYKSGDARGALEAMQGAERLAEETGDLEIVVNVQGVRTVAHLYLDELDEAESAARIGLEACATLDWERAKAYPLRNLAEVAIGRGSFDEAHQYLAQARAIASTHTDKRQLTRIRLTGAKLALFERQGAAALQEVTALERDAAELGLMPEQQELRGLRTAAMRATHRRGTIRHFRRRRPLRFTDAPIGGD
jgi:tetratricopeptide (TPR) repeat protein